MIDEDKILAEYHSLKPSLISWGETVDSILINNILCSQGFDIMVKILPKFRIKDEKSYLSKALYRKKEYKNPILDIEDKIGTRIVILKSDDIIKIQKKILSHSGWKSKLTKNIHQEIEDKPKLFDYQSSHIVVYPKSNHLDYKGVSTKHITCEIQIRTLLQHAFAEVSHDSTYKGPYQNDKEILRGLAKSMALMEATDDYFCKIFNMMTDQKREYSHYLKELLRLFKEFKSDFKSTEIDLYLTDNLFKLIVDSNPSIADLEEFIEKRRDELNKYISKDNGRMFRQPIIILTLYLFYKKRTFLNEKWPLNLQSLKSIYTITGTSFKNY